MAAPERSFVPQPSVREPGWSDPGPRLSAPVDCTGKAKRPSVLDIPCPDPAFCCAAFLAAEGMIVWQNVEPFRADRPTPPTAYIASDGGHGGMEPISFCPFCGARIVFREVSNGSPD